jgi:hypothetical protein
MNESSNLRELLLKYRANELDDAERERIDVRMMSDPEFSDALQEAEYDLLDAYAAGELSSEDRARVERAFSPEQRLTPITMTKVDSTAPAQHARVLVMPKRVMPPSRRRGWVVPLTIAAGLVIALLLAVSWRRNQVAVPAREIANRPAVPELHRAPEVSAPTASAKPQSVDPRKAVGLSEIATVLLPSVQRSNAASTLHLTATTKTVRFTWPVAADGGGSAYALEVASDAGESLCRARGLSEASGKQGRLVTFTCNASKIPSGSVFVRVLPLSTDADAAPLLEVSFLVRRD